MGGELDSGKDSPGAAPKLNRKAPVWGWEGKYTCPVCEEEVYMEREEGFEFVTEHWVVQCYHDHSPENPQGVWHFSVYNQYKGRRRPEIVKAAKEQHSEAYKAQQQARRIENAGS